MRSVRYGLVLAALGVARMSAQDLPKATVRDSSSVRIIEYSTIRTAHAAFRIAPKLLADVGGLRDDANDEVDSRFSFISVRFSDGRIAVQENYTVRILDASGKFVRLLGGRGGGPGYFDTQVSQLCVIRGDSLVVIAGRRRMSLFDSRGNHVRSTTLDASLEGRCGASGELIGSVPTVSPEEIRKMPENERPVFQAHAILRYMTREGRLGDSIGVFETHIGNQGFGSIVPDYFSVAMYNGGLYADNGCAPELKYYTRQGKLASIIRWNDSLPKLTPEIVRKIAISTAPTNAPRSQRDAHVARMLAIPQRKTLPAYGPFWVDRAGRLWMRESGYGDRGERIASGYIIFTASGALIGRYDAPNLKGYYIQEVTEAGADYIIVRYHGLEEGTRYRVYSIVLQP